MDNSCAQECLLQHVGTGHPVCWLNKQALGADKVAVEAVLHTLPLHATDFLEAQQRWISLAPLIAHLFPDCKGHGQIDSPLIELKKFGKLVLPKLQSESGTVAPRLFLKADNNLPVCGSVKARGGMFEVLQHAVQVATAAGLLQPSDSTALLATDGGIRQLLQQHCMAVGSTGNLGLSVGISAAAVGMQAVVHMSSDAKAWKKELLRSRGVQVIEHSGDYSAAVAAGRAAAASDPFCHFVDDEHSRSLFLGYSTAALYLKAQLAAAGVKVSEDQPLVVYIPCGVGGAPGGICWGLKHVFGPAVHVFYAEPTQACCCLLGLATGKHADVSVQDAGLSGVTVADGLAVARASQLCCDMTGALVSGVFTATDDSMLQGVAQLWMAEGLFVEPSCAAVFQGPAMLAQLLQTKPQPQQPEQQQQQQQQQETQLDDAAAVQASAPAAPTGCSLAAQALCVDEPCSSQCSALHGTHGCFWGPCPAGTAEEAKTYVHMLLERGTHVLWATGGAFVPELERQAILSQGGISMPLVPKEPCPLTQ